MYTKRTQVSTTAGNTSVETAVADFEQRISNVKAEIRALDAQVLAKRGQISEYEKTLVHLRAALTAAGGNGHATTRTPFTPRTKSFTRKTTTSTRAPRLLAEREPGGWQRDIENLMHSPNAPTTKRQLLDTLKMQHPSMPFARIYGAVMYAISSGRIVEAGEQIAWGQSKKQQHETVTQ